MTVDHAAGGLLLQAVLIVADGAVGILLLAFLLKRLWEALWRSADRVRGWVRRSEGWEWARGGVRGVGAHYRYVHGTPGCCLLDS